MWITNDVALITFVPFAIMTLSMVGQKKYIIRIVVLQTIAANLGSMLMPIGNPQNLYLYSNYNLSMGEFLKITLPCTAVSLFLLCITILSLKNAPISANQAEYKEILPGKTRHIVFYGILFLLCIATVLQLLDYRITFLIVIFTILLTDLQVLRRIDYSLLLTFVCFFIFVGNIGNISAVKNYLAALLNGKELPAAIAISQVISNVPCAVLLSAFTDDYKALILGTDIGGLGTLVASLASLISYKFYCKTENAKIGKYLLVFTIYNLLFLVVLCLLFIS
jgi:Na+/H+ antiporter NhaD and related arsenite permeases